MIQFPGTLPWFVIGAFLIGSIPFGLIISSIFYRTDIRKSGSGNIGAMNALRSLGKRGAVAVLLLDAAKGIIPAAAFLWLNGGEARNLSYAALITAAAVVGHCFSPWLKFKGGKGVATSIGALFAMCWPAGIAAIAGWLLGALTTSYSSVGSILAHVVAPFALWYFTRNPMLAAYGVFALTLILYTHRDNLARLRSGQEQGISFLRRKRGAS